MLVQSIKRITMPLPKIIVIAGTTGVGKSQLSIELATKYNGEIINSDAMQVYKDVPIITNKHPIDERNGIPHHIINYIDWDQEYDLHRFENDTNLIIDDILKRGKLPIIVGGTHYYLQILFDKFISTSEFNDNSEIQRQISSEEKNLLDNGDKFEIFKILQEIDPVIASRYHPNDTKRIHRLLEIYYTTGQKPSDLFAKQEKKLRYDVLFFWLYSDPTELNKRLDSRVDDMVKSGALDEIKQLYDYYKTQENPNDHGGIWQVIGFKEFLPWLKTGQNDNKLWNEGVERMKLHTRQYARRQVKWIQKMLIPDINNDIYVLNATDLSKWHQLAGERAARIADLFLHNKNDNKAKTELAPRAPKELLSLISTEQTAGKKRGTSEDDCKHFTCDICKDQNDVKLIAIGVKQWETHLKSRRHKGNLTRGNKQAAYEKWKAQQEQDV